jgi:transcriptional regulator with XRE-family HTH domain
LRRVEIGLSQSEPGEKLAVSFQQVQKYEKGVNRVGASPLQQITLMAMTDVGHGQPLPLIEEASIERLLLAQRSHPS